MSFKEKYGKLVSDLEKLLGGQNAGDELEPIRTAMERMKRLADGTAKYFKEDENGKLPPVPEEDLPAIRELYRSTLAALETVAGSTQDTGIWPAARNLAGELSGIMSLDYAALDVALGAKGRSLDQILVEGRSLVVDTGNQPFAVRSGAMSERVPMTVVDENGVRREGFFTRSTTLSMEPFHDTLDRFAEKYPSLKDLFGNIKNYSAEEIVEMKNLGGTDLIEKEVGLELKGVDDCSDQELHDLLARGYKKYLRPEDAERFGNDPAFVRAMTEFGNSCVSFLNSYESYVGEESRMKCRPGVNVDKRNSAMSAVYGMLGHSHLLAPSKPMIVYSNGKAISGTFMEKATGYEMGNVSDENPIRDMNSEVRNNPGVFKDIAAMQAFDFICGNIDRHYGNFFVRFEEQDGELKLAGLSGIDNDLSFPEDDIPDKVQSFWTVAPDKMRVIGTEAAAYIMLLDENALRVALRGYGVSEKAIDYTWKRTKALQDKITEGLDHYADAEPGRLDDGFLRVVPPEEWSSYKFEDLSRSGNFFHTVGELNTIHNSQRKRAEEDKVNRSAKKGIADRVLQAAGLPAAEKATEPIVAVPLGRDLNAGIEADRAGREADEEKKRNRAAESREAERRVIDLIKDPEKKADVQAAFDSRIAVDDILASIKSDAHNSVFRLSMTAPDQLKKFENGKFSLADLTEEQLTEAEQYFDKTFKPLIDHQEALYGKLGITDRTVAGSFSVTNCLDSLNNKSKHLPEHAESIIKEKHLDQPGMEKQADRYRKAAVVFALSREGSRIAFKQAVDSTDPSKEPRFRTSTVKLNGLKRVGMLERLREDDKKFFKSQETTLELAEMFATKKSGRFYSEDTPVYREAKKALDDYVSALNAVDRQIRELYDKAFCTDKEPISPETYINLRDRILDGSRKEIERLGKELHGKMTTYVDHATKNDSRTIDKVKKSAGTARLASGREILWQLADLYGMQIGVRDVEQAQAEKVKDTSFRKLFKTYLEQEAKAPDAEQGEQAAEQRRIRAARRARDEMKQSGWRNQNQH